MEVTCPELNTKKTFLQHCKSLFEKTDEATPSELRTDVTYLDPRRALDVVCQGCSWYDTTVEDAVYMLNNISNSLVSCWRIPGCIGELIRLEKRVAWVLLKLFVHVMFGDNITFSLNTWWCQVTKFIIRCDTKFCPALLSDVNLAPNWRDLDFHSSIRTSGVKWIMLSPLQFPKLAVLISSF